MLTTFVQNNVKLLNVAAVNLAAKMAASPTDEVTENTVVTNCSDNAENEAEEALDDFLRDTNDLIANSTEDASNSPDSSGDVEGEDFNSRDLIT